MNYQALIDKWQKQVFNVALKNTESIKVCEDLFVVEGVVVYRIPESNRIINVSKFGEISIPLPNTQSFGEIKTTGLLVSDVNKTFVEFEGNGFKSYFNQKLLKPFEGVGLILKQEKEFMPAYFVNSGGFIMGMILPVRKKAWLDRDLVD